jgi:hypothetical protein
MELPENVTEWTIETVRAVVHAFAYELAQIDFKEVLDPTPEMQEG